MTSVRIINDSHLPRSIAGLTDGTTIWLNPSLTPAGRRCTLAHELVHVERGLPPAYQETREERIVDRLAAHRLTSTEELLEAIIWTQGGHSREALAAELNIDLDTLDTRLRTATDEERNLINTALAELEQTP